MGLAAAEAWPAAAILCSGRGLTTGPSEAAVMDAALRAGGVAASRLILDEVSRDTLQNAGAAARTARQVGAEGVVVCTDGYHVARARLLLWALGVRTVTGPSAGPVAGTWHRGVMALREVVAIPYDLMLALMHRRRLLS
jgi:uncharacterized SAM-binding protein YcdF (DUF218 family)